MGNFKEDIARIRAFVFDVDGVMTDGGITVTPEGEFLRTFYAKDGYALSLALKKGYRIAIITGGRGKALQVRFDMIGIEHVYTNCHHKLKAQPVRGEQIYIDRKQKRWEGNARHHIVTEGETVASVAQSYALREKSLRKLNRLKAGAALRTGQTLRIR